MPYSFRQLDWNSSPESLTRSYLFSETTAFSFATEKGVLQTHSFSVEDAGLSISRVTSTGHDIALTESKRVTLILPFVGEIKVGIGGMGLSANPSGALLILPNHRKTRVIADARMPYQAYVVMLPVGLLPSGADTGIIDRNLALRSESLDKLHVHLRLIFSSVEYGKRHEFCGPANAEYVLSLFEDATGRTDHPKRFPALRGGARVQARAEDFIRANFSRPLTMAEIAESAGISVRRLQLVFRSISGSTPYHALNLARMEAARMHLLDPNEGRSVTEIAFDCGFTHLSRFAAAYRERYGQHPSSTLRASKH